MNVSAVPARSAFCAPAAPATVRRRRRRSTAVGVLCVVAVVAAACSSSGGPSQASSSTTATSAPSSSPSKTLITTMDVSGKGRILVNNQGQVLYSFTKNGAAVACSAACLQVWPAVTLPPGVTTPTGSAGVGTLGTTTANDVTQVTVNGQPLYTYAGDPAPGVADGNNIVSFGGTWKVVKAS